MLGRPPIPRAIKIAQNYRADRINGFDPTPAGPLGDPPAPLDEVGSAAWVRIAREVEAMKVATSADAEMLFTLCQNISIRHAAQEAIQEHGLLIPTANGGLKPNPAFAMRTQADGLVVKILAHFGMSPSARSRIAAPPPPDENPLDEFEG